jgi:hypothetical protein
MGVLPGFWRGPSCFLILKSKMSGLQDVLGEHVLFMQIHHTIYFAWRT